jgi:intracellular sulfur oxidation DsrE/DsrF family protein
MVDSRSDKVGRWAARNASSAEPSDVQPDTPGKPERGTEFGQLVIPPCAVYIYGVERVSILERNLDMSSSEKPLHIDIPVKLAAVSVVFSVASLSFEGDLPASIFHLQLIEKDAANWNAMARIVVVFHTNAGHVTLNDQSYNSDRLVATGNPYRALLDELMKRGVQVELCGATAKAHNWGNADVFPGVKINTDAMARLTQLVQEGYVKITE